MNHRPVNQSKYRAMATVIDNIRFHSMREAARYKELRLLERAGEIQGLELQPVYPLHVVGGFVKDIVHRIGEYRADFKYVDVPRGEVVVEDAKGFRTPLYRWKKKHIEAEYGIKIREI